MAERIVLIDGLALVFRAWFALPMALTAPDGTPTNAAFGFAQMFERLAKMRRAQRGAVVFDAPGRSFRSLRYAAYKQNREAMPEELRAQLPLIERIVEAWGVPVLRELGVEADDVIATLARQGEAAGFDVVIVSGDKDFNQLVTDKVRVDDPIGEVTVDRDLVFRRYGVRPEQFADYLALVGDTADNVPGVAGIGKKGAALLLTEHGTLEALLDAAAGLPGRYGELLREQSDTARLSRELVSLEADIPLPLGIDDLEIRWPDRSAIDDLYRELGFFSLLSSDEAPDSAVIDEGIVTTDLELHALLDALDPEEPVAVLVLHDLPTAARGELAGVAVRVAPELCRYIPLPGQLSREGGARLARWLADPEVPKVVHMARDAHLVLARHGLVLGGVVLDTALASFLHDPARALPHTLDVVVREYLHRALPSFRSLVGRGKARQPLRSVPIPAVARFACAAVEAVGALGDVLGDALEPREHRILRDVDLPLAELLAQMSLTGVAVDAEALRALETGLSEEGRAVEQDVFALVGREFNIGSVRQLGAVLFEELGLPVLKRTKTGYSTAASVLEKLVDQHPVVPLVLRWRTLAKLVSSYTAVLQAAFDPHTGRIHPTFQQTVSPTGRLITTEPDLQKTPTRSAEGIRVREAFVASAGCVLVAADWSQIELRLLAHFSGDPVLVEAFSAGRDVHTETAATLFDVPVAAVTSEQRNLGKTVNFATIYGQGAAALGQQVGLSRDDAQALIDRYFERLSGVAAWKQGIVAKASTTGRVPTLLGRWRVVRELSSNNPTDRSYGERIAVNSPIQGSAADLCKLAMLELAQALAAHELSARLVLQIHDELLLDVPVEEVDAVTALVKAVMEGVLRLRVPLVADVGVGRTWASAKA